jgi:hypothetical protein
MAAHALVTLTAKDSADGTRNLGLVSHAMPDRKNPADARE